LPCDYERPAGVDVGNGADRAFVGFDIAVASNSDPSAASEQHDAYSQKYKRDLLHVNVLPVVKMRQR